MRRNDWSQKGKQNGNLILGEDTFVEINIIRNSIKWERTE